MSKSLVNTCIYETDWSIKLLPYANITDISTDITDISTDIDADIISVSLLNFTNIRYYRYCRYFTDTDINISASLTLSKTCITISFTPKLDNYT